MSPASNTLTLHPPRTTSHHLQTLSLSVFSSTVVLLQGVSHVSSLVKSTTSKASAAIGHNVARLKHAGSSPSHAADLAPSAFATRDLAHRIETASASHSAMSSTAERLSEASTDCMPAASTGLPRAVDVSAVDTSEPSAPTASAQLEAPPPRGSDAAAAAAMKEGQLDWGGVQVAQQLSPTVSGEHLSDTSSSWASSERVTRRSSISEQLARASEGSLGGLGSGSFAGEGQSERKGLFVRLQVCLGRVRVAVFTVGTWARSISPLSMSFVVPVP
jgi:hypothetical protein